MEAQPTNVRPGIEKVPTGIPGLDEITELSPPFNKSIGDLSDIERVLVGLDVKTRD
ncbi:MAG TPA: hypothetical protein VIK22_11475 [Candidatus Anoxymicrobiaceae bacterium]